MKCAFCSNNCVVGFSNNPLEAETGLCEYHNTEENIKILKEKMMDYSDYQRKGINFTPQNILAERQLNACK